MRGVEAAESIHLFPVPVGEGGVVVERAGQRVEALGISGVGRVDLVELGVLIDARGGAREIVLANAQHRFTVRVRAHDPVREPTIRRGGWAIDLDAPESLPTAARVALGILVRALPDDREAGGAGAFSA